MSRQFGRRWVALIPIALLAVASVVAVRTADTHVVAYVSSAPGLYEGDKVKVMGVVVGRVQSVKPKGDRVRLELAIDSQPIPADARAAIVAPSMVSERFVQLAPAYTRGRKMRNGDVIPLSRTAIPVSFDEVKRELTDLATALGPAPGQQGETGALNRAIRTLDANLNADSAAQLRDSLTAMRGATENLADGGDDLFSTLHNLNIFVKNLAVNDRAARQLTGDMAEFTGVLDDNKHELGDAVAGLDEVLKLLRQFVKDNGPALETAVTNLEHLTGTVASRSNELGGVLHAAPTAIANLYNTVDNQAVTARVMATANVRDLSQLLCGAILGIGKSVAECKAALAPLASIIAALDPQGSTGLVSKQSAGSSPTSAPPPAVPPPLRPNVPNVPKLPILNGLLDHPGAQ